MSQYVKVASAAEVPDPGKIVVEIDERLVVVLHIGGEFYCVDDVCTHDGGPLGEGELNGYNLCCPRHGAAFDVRSGAAMTMPATEPTVAHAIKVENGDVLVQLNED